MTKDRIIKMLLKKIEEAYEEGLQGGKNEELYDAYDDPNGPYDWEYSKAFEFVQKFKEAHK